MTRIPSAAVGMALTVATGVASALDYSFSGFATLGYTRSDQSFTYQRFIDDAGTFRRDSVVGGQVDLRFNHQFGATAQVKLGPAEDSDNKQDLFLSWAFLSFRPTNSLLVRVGKLRVPLYLYSEYIDIGAAYDFARLPTEMYSIAPTTDFIGASINYSNSFDFGDLSIDAYTGNTDTYQRFYRRDSFFPIINSGPEFVAVKVDSIGLAVSLRRDEDQYRASIHRVNGRRDEGDSPEYFPFVELVPGSGIGFFQTSNALPGPGVPGSDEISATIITLGFDQGLPYDLRLSGELSNRVVENTDIGPDSTGGYLALRKRIGKWTPYLIYAFLRSEDEILDTYAAVNSNRVPAAFDPFGLINFSQRAGADGIFAYDQSSWSLGVSYSLTPTSKLKFEVQRARIGDVSSLVDAQEGGDISDHDINSLAASYSIVF